MLSLQVMALQGVHTVHLISTFPIADEMMSQVTFGQSIIEKWQRPVLQNEYLLS